MSQKKVNRFEIRIIQYHLIFRISTLKYVESITPYWLNSENRFSKGQLFMVVRTGQDSGKPGKPGKYLEC
jgi:hypothetical protein